MPPNLPNPVTLIGSFFSAITNYLQQKQIRQEFAQLVQFLWTFVTVVESLATDIATIFRKVKLAWADAKTALDRVGGDIKGIAIDNHDMWHHLRYTLMPNTINWIFAWVWSNWIKQLREGLVKTIGWQGRWNWYQQRWILDNREYTRVIQVKTRDWRQAYVYPQLMFLLSPWRVAYWYAQQITVAVSTYLNASEHHETRDTVSRVVYSGMSHLWQSFDKHLAEWLLTDVSNPGYGSNVPAFPNGSKVPPPHSPPTVWEPFVRELQEPPYPDGSPDIPKVDWQY